MVCLRTVELVVRTVGLDYTSILTYTENRRTGTIVWSREKYLDSVVETDT